MKFMNLTPHAIVLRPAEGVEITVPPSGQLARASVATLDQQPLLVDGKSIPVVRNTFGAIEGLPAPDGETIFIVSIVVLGQLKGRTDVVCPDTSPAGVIRDASGKIEAVRRLVAPDA